MDNTVERTDILNSVGEIRKRLQALKRYTDLMRSDVLGECEAKQDAPEQIPANHLDGRVSEIFPLLNCIESSMQRLMNRLGVSEGPKGVQNPGRAANY